MKRAALSFVALVVAVCSLQVSAASVRIANNDGANEGFNDPTEADPVGGNPGTTVGAQRLIAFQFAADLWAGLLNGDDEVVVRANFDPQECTSTSAVLGSAGPLNAIRDFPGAPIPGMYYVVALANRLARQDLNGGTAEVRATFNSDIGTEGCFNNSPWYYGLDNNPPPGHIDLVVVVLHELGHGLGFIALYNRDTGALFEGFPDIYTAHLIDGSTETLFTDMTKAERQAASVKDGEIAWVGRNAVAAAPSFLEGEPTVTVNSPASVAGDYEAGTASFGPLVDDAGVTGTLVQALDAANASGPSTTDGCTAFSNANEVAGNIAIIDRGKCTFVQKVLNAQAAGAVGVIIVNNVAGDGVVEMAGDDESITIPVLSVSLEDGAEIRTALESGISVTLRADPSSLAGTDDQDRPLIYAPNPLQAGSSISHWDTRASPNLLMEPNVTATLGHGIDLSRDAFSDMGWFSAAVVESTMRDEMAVDNDSDGKADPGDVVRLLVTIQNNGGTDARGVRFTSSVPAGAQLVRGSVKSTAGTTSDTNGIATVQVGDLDVGSEVTIIFDILIEPLNPTPPASIAIQGQITGTNIDSLVTDDPSTVQAADATVIQIDPSPVAARKSASIVNDLDEDGSISRGETIRYSIIVTNERLTSLSGVVLTDDPDPNTTIVAGSVTTTLGTVTSGNSSGDSTVVVSIGNMAPGAAVTVTFEARVNDATPDSVFVISNQAVVTGNGFPPTLSDDPATVPTSDPTELGFALERRRGIRHR
ncbi:MAG: DUF11 domain-containing protein [Acidobacteria bacterium]|nr:DUF11 domain-containing protein [Acidobacteriota bacterium]